MNIQEIYELFDQIGSLTFATVENGEPRTRIAHLFASPICSPTTGKGSTSGP